MIKNNNIVCEFVKIIHSSYMNRGYTILIRSTIYIYIYSKIVYSLLANVVH